MNSRQLAAVLCLAAVCLFARQASAQSGYAGVWKAGPSRIAVTVHSWGNDCGPRPESTTQPGGGTVEITEYGRNLAIHATDRTILTNACWSQNRAIARVSSSFLDGVWTTKCRTPPSDPKSEEGEYILKVENNGTLQYRDKSDYNWELRSSRCVATIVTTQTLTRATESPTPAAATTPTKAPPAPVEEPVVEEPETPEPSGCVPGAPSRLVMRPKRVQIEPGQRTCVRAVVLDAAGCVVRNSDVRWTMQHSPALRGSLAAGCFEAASSAAEAEGEFKLVAQSSGLRGEAIVEVSTVDFSDLMAKRIETGAVTGHTAPTNAAAQAQSHSAARVQATEPPPTASLAPLLVAGAGAVIALIGLLWWMRRRAAVPERTSVRPSASSSLRPVAPATRSSGPSPAAPVAPVAPAAPVSHVAPAATAAAETWICPTCRRGAPASQITCRCTQAGTPLMPYADFAKLGRDAPLQDRKRCGGCGHECPIAAGFCGECGKRF